ncbi:MAG: DUF2232 domain-containing protein [Nitrospinae bacterium]|nr:DUF2232 domain-containing protein [Nitrospinota bacterium]
MSGPKLFANVLFPVVVFTGILVLILIVPPVGLVASIVLPTPIVLIFLSHGRQAGLIAAALLFFIFYGLSGSTQVLVLLGEFTVMAFLLAETIKGQFSFEKCILISAIGSALVSLSLMFSLYGGGDKSLTVLFQEKFKKSVEVSLKSLKGTGEEMSGPDNLEEIIEETSKKLARSYPALIAVGSLFTAMINYFFILWIWPRFYGSALVFSGEFSEWSLPDYFVWPFILSAVGAFFTGDAVQVVGMNLFILLLMIYFLQGIAIVHHFLQTKKVPVVFRVIAFILIFTQPVFIGLAIGMGVFDLWVDFRKIRAKSSEMDES